MLRCPCHVTRLACVVNDTSYGAPLNSSSDLATVEVTQGGSKWILPFDAVQVDTAVHPFGASDLWRGAVTRDGSASLSGPASAVTANRLLTVHGASSHHTLRIFLNAVEDLVKDADGIATLDSHDESSYIGFSVARIYSWGATDVLVKESIESNTTSPSRHSQATSRRPSCPSVGSLDIHHLKQHRVRDLAALRTILQDICFVPEGHSAVLVALHRSWPDGMAQRTHVCLLPTLHRVNRFFYGDLLDWRTDVARYASTPTMDMALAGRRLASFLWIFPSPYVCLITVLSSCSAPELNLQSSWYGSIIASDEATGPLGGDEATLSLRFSRQQKAAPPSTAATTPPLLQHFAGPWTTPLKQMPSFFTSINRAPTPPLGVDALERPTSPIASSSQSAEDPPPPHRASVASSGAVAVSTAQVGLSSPDTERMEQTVCYCEVSLFADKTSHDDHGGSKQVDDDKKASLVAEIQSLRQQRDALCNDVVLFRAELVDLKALKVALEASLNDAVESLVDAATEVEEQEADLALSVERASLFLRRNAASACADDARRTARLMELLQNYKVLFDLSE